MAKVVTLGEILLRMSPLGSSRLDQTNNCETVFGGSEANVAVALATYGVDSVYVTKLPQNAFGQAALNKLRQYGVNTSHIIRGGERLGMYLLEKGYTPCSTVCTYDRKHSAIAEANVDEFDWEAIFDGAEMFHFSGITAALSPEAARICEKACQVASDLRVFISCDVNYRSKLWSMKEASAVMGPLCNRYVNMLIINEEEARVLGCNVVGEDLTVRENFAKMVEELLPGQYSLITSVARIKNASAVKGMLWTRGSGILESEEYPLHVVDPVGAGDAFSAALIYQMIHIVESTDEGPKSTEWRQQVVGDMLNFATAACALKHSVMGDFNLTPLETIGAVAEKKAGDGVKR